MLPLVLLCALAASANASIISHESSEGAPASATFEPEPSVPAPTVQVPSVSFEGFSDVAICVKPVSTCEWRAVEIAPVSHPRLSEHMWINLETSSDASLSLTSAV